MLLNGKLEKVVKQKLENWGRKWSRTLIPSSLRDLTKEITKLIKDERTNNIR